jgi:hypothetical protein
MTNFRKAPESIVEAVERRLERAMPGTQLEKRSVKLCAVPGTHFDATIFRYRKNGRRFLVAELARPDLPHVYASYPVSDNAIQNAARIIAALFSLAKRIRIDPKFQSNIIVLR